METLFDTKKLKILNFDFKGKNNTNVQYDPFNWIKHGI